MKNLFFIALAFLTLTTFSQNSEKAVLLLNEVSAKVASYDTILLSFDYLLDNENENIHQKTTGKVSLQGEHYHLNFMGIERIYDTKKIYTIIHEDEEVVISSGNNEDENEFTPSKILTFYQKGYRFKWDVLKTIGGKKIQFIKLLPKNVNAENQFILLGIDTRSKNIHQVVYANKNNTHTTFKIRSFKTNTSFPKGEFTFDEAKYTAKDYIITRL
ncbi:MAG TPA: outer membrane lipoprotein carrier protein LolA [Lutibacter sp.]|nr:outer membrane lipoprotein carrier protein LolA [Lutibacter sp.]